MHLSGAPCLATTLELHASARILGGTRFSRRPKFTRHHSHEYAHCVFGIGATFHEATGLNQPDHGGQSLGRGFKIVDPAGHVLAGTYRVTGLISFERAPGTFPPLADEIGNPQEASAGLAFLRVSYSDGRRGVLVVSCHLVGTPDFVFERITASRSFVDFWNREAPQAQPFVDANRTLFYITPAQ